MWPGILWAAIILALCVVPAEVLEPVDIWNIDYFDKLAHAGVFALLALLIYRGSLGLNSDTAFNRRPIFYTLLVTILYGGLTELIQGVFIFNRVADVFDFLADSIGAGLGIVIAKISEKRITKLW